MPDLRQSTRKELSANLTLSANNLDWHGVTVDVSVGGIGALLPFEPFSDSFVVSFNIQESSITATANLRYSYFEIDIMRYRVGLQFEGLSEQNRVIIDQFVNS